VPKQNKNSLKQRKKFRQNENKTTLR